MAVKVLLKEIRAKRGLSQNELARKIEMSLNAIQHIEYKAKAIQLDTLGKLCEALDCQPGDLLIWVPDDSGGQESSIEKDDLKDLKQTKESIDESYLRQRQNSRSFLTVIPEVPESA